jgi:hypothetical protein
MCTSEKMVEELLFKAAKQGLFTQVHSLAKEIKNQSDRTTYSEAIEQAYNKLSR